MMEFQQSVEAVAQMEHVLKVHLRRSLKHLHGDFRLEGEKVSIEMKIILKDCDVCAQREVANCAAMLSNRLAEVRMDDVSAPLALDTS